MWRSGDDEVGPVYCELLFEARELRRVFAVAKALEPQTRLRNRNLEFGGALRRFFHVHAEELKLFPVALERLWATELELEAGFCVWLVSRERWAEQAQPRRVRSTPRFEAPEPQPFKPGVSYTFARLVSKSDRTDAVLLDSTGQHHAVPGYRFVGRAPAFGDRVTVDEHGVVRAVRRRGRPPSVLARDTSPAAQGGGGAPDPDADPLDDALLRAVSIVREWKAPSTSKA